MLLEKWYSWPQGLKSAARTQGLVPTSAPTHAQRGSQRTMDTNGGANKSECVIVPIRVCRPGTGSSASCLPSCLALCPTKTTLRASVGSAPNTDQGICRPTLTCLPLCWQFDVEMLLSDTAQKSEYFFRVRIETENPLGESLLSFEIAPASFSAAPLFLSVLLGSSPGS